MFINEGGKALGVSSQIPKKFVIPTIKNGMKQFGLEDVDYKPVGNISAEISNDIDLSISVESLAKKWNLPKPYYSDEFWDAIKERVSQIPGAKYNPGLKEFHIPFNVVDSSGNQQPMYVDGKPVPNSSGVTQVDFFVGSQEWMKDILSGKPEGSGYKAAFRNVLLGSIISTIDRYNTKPVITKQFPQGEFEEHKYVLNFKSGVEKIITKFANPSGSRQKNPKKVSVSRESFLEDQNEMAKWLFGDNYSWQDINSFEKALNAFNQSQYFNKKYGKYKSDIIEKVKETLKPEQLQMLQNSEYSSIFAESLNEGRESIGRFSGKNEFTPAEFLILLQKLVEETGNVGKADFTIDLLQEPSVDMVEKMDASFIHFGVNKDGKFFMESNYSGEVTIENAEEKFGFREESIKSFEYLYKNAKFQKALQQIYKTYGPIRFDSEMFPVFTHTGSKSGDIIFASTRYRKEKFGQFGGSVIFKCSKWDDATKDWVRPEPAVSAEIISNFKKLSSGFQKDWKIYSNDEDMRLPGTIPVKLGELAEKLKPENFNKTLELIKSRKESDKTQKDILLSQINNLKTQLQNGLNQFADNASSKLGDSKSNVEGVVLRIKTKSGDVFEVKGTSQKFAEQAKIVWEDRSASDAAKEEFLITVKKKVLSLPNSTDKTILSTIKKNIEEKGSTMQQAIVSIVIEPERALQELEQNLNVGITVAREKAKNILESINNKKGVLDADSERKSYDYIKNLNALLDAYQEISNLKITKDKKYFKIFEKFYGAKLDFLKAEKPASTRVIIWNGRAQPWHKGHSNMIEIGKKKLAELKAEKVVIMIVKGGKSSKDLITNPLNLEQQVALVSSIFAGQSNVQVMEEGASNVFGIMDMCSRNKFIIAGWLAGEEDRVDEYRRVIDRFNPEKFMTDHDFVPFELDKATGKPIVKFIETPRVFSGTKSREMIKDPKVKFEQWFKEVAPENISSEAKKQYKIVYNIIKENTPNELQEIVISILDETIRKRGNKYCLISKKSKKNLGCYRSRAKAKKREKQVQYFKHMKEEASGTPNVQGYSEPLGKEENK